MQRLLEMSLCSLPAFLVFFSGDNVADYLHRRFVMKNPAPDTLVVFASARVAWTEGGHRRVVMRSFCSAISHTLLPTVYLQQSEFRTLQ